MVAAELKTRFRMDLAPQVIARAWPRMKLTGDISLEVLQEFVRSAQQVGFLRSMPDLSRLVVTP